MLKHRKSLPESYLKSKRKLMRSVISLFLATVMMATSTYAWFSMGNPSVSYNTPNFELDCGKELRVNDGGTSNISFKDRTQYLLPASSYDGRNLFFPTDGSDFSAETKQMTFRSANVGDKNVNYIEIDFDLTAQQDHTAIYINDEKTAIRVAAEGTSQDSDTGWSTQMAAPLRAALWYEGAVDNKPVVFNPLENGTKVNAVTQVDRSSGQNAQTSIQYAAPFSEYSYKGGRNPVAILDAHEKTRFKFIVWLEGTDSKCTYERINGKDIRIDLAFTTSWDNTETIRFRDSSSSGWIKDLIDNDHYTLSIRHEYTDKQNETNYNDYTLREYKVKGENEWYCELPGDVQSKLTFYLRPSPTSTDQNTYVFWKYDEDDEKNTYDRGTSRVYETKMSKPTSGFENCNGHWVALGDSDGPGTGSGSGDGDDF